MAKKMNKKNWYKGISATAITLALAGAALSVPAFAGDVTDTDTTENIPTTGTSSNEKISENVLTETVLSSENVDVDWETPEPSEENNSMVSEGTVTEDELVIGDVTKEETTVETVQPPVYDTEHAESETTQTVNPDGSITETTTTTTPGSQTTETTVSGTITGEIETTPELTEDETSKIEGEITSGIETSISKGEFDWQGMASGSTMTIGDYTVTKNQNGSFTFSKVDSQEGSLSDSDIAKLFGEGYSWNDDGNLVDEDGHVITISGNTATVTTETKVDVTITDTTEIGSESVDTDLAVSGGTDQTEVNNIFQKLEDNNGSYTYDGSAAEVTKDTDGNITSIVVGNTTYTFTYTSNGSSSVTDPNEIAKLLGSDYTCQEGTIYKINSDGSKSEITLDEANTVLNKESVTVSVTITETENETIATVPNDFTYNISSSNEFDLALDVYKEIYKQITGYEYTGENNPSTAIDKNGNSVSFSYSSNNNGYVVTLTTTISGQKFDSMEASKLASLLGEGYTAENGKIYKDGQPVEVTIGNDQSIQLKTYITINKKEEHVVITPDSSEQGGSNPGTGGSYNSYDWSNTNLNFYIRLDGNIVDDKNAADQPKSEYTGSVGTGKLGALKENGEKLPTTNTNTWVYQGTVDQPDENGNVETTADEVIRSYFDYSSDNDKGPEHYAVTGVPSDQYVFEKIFQSNQTVYYNYKDENGLVSTKILTQADYNAHPEDYAIYWYVLKYDSTDGFHIDGCVVSKEHQTIVQTKYVYTLGQVSQDNNGSITATVTNETTKEATADSVTGQIQYMIPHMPQIKFSTPVVTTTTAVDLDYTSQYETVTNIESVVTNTETILPVEPPVDEPEPPVDQPVIEPEEDDIPQVEEPTEEIIEEEETPLTDSPVEEVIEDEDTPLTDTPVEEVIEDNETPLAELAAVETIDDEATPLAAAPQTGVTGSAGAAALPFMVAAAAITAFFKCKRNNG